MNIWDFNHSIEMFSFLSLNFPWFYLCCWFYRSSCILWFRKGEHCKRIFSIMNWCHVSVYQSKSIHYYRHCKFYFIAVILFFDVNCVLQIFFYKFYIFFSYLWCHFFCARWYHSLLFLDICKWCLHLDLWWSHLLKYGCFLTFFSFPFLFKHFEHISNPNSISISMEKSVTLSIS